MYSVFLSSYGNTHESLGELEKAVETRAAQHFSFSQTSTRVSITCFLFLKHCTVCEERPLLLRVDRVSNHSHGFGL